MNKHLLYLLFISIIFNSYVFSSSNDVDFEGLLNIKLAHSLSYNTLDEFVERGNITIHGGVSTVINLPLSLIDKNKLQVLATDDKLYRLKATVVNNDGSETSFLTSIKACMLGQSGLNDFLTVSLDHMYSVIGISIGVHPSIPCQGSNVGLDRISKFNTKVYVTSITAGPIPDTASYIQKLEREREAKERGDVKDNRSFLAKYWMYIVPVVMIMVLSSFANPDGTAGGGGSGGRQG